MKINDAHIRVIFTLLLIGGNAISAQNEALAIPTETVTPTILSGTYKGTNYDLQDGYCMSDSNSPVFGGVADFANTSAPSGYASQGAVLSNGSLANVGASVYYHYPVPVYAVNNNGDAAGNASTIEGFSSSIYFWKASTGTMTTLQGFGTVPGNPPVIFAYGMTDSDQIVGYSTDSYQNPSGNYIEYYAAFETTNGLSSYQLLPAFSNSPAHPSTVAFGINKQGRMAGGATSANGTEHACYWSTATSTPTDLANKYFSSTGDGSVSLAVDDNDDVVCTDNSENIWLLVHYSGGWTPHNLGSFGYDAILAFLSTGLKVVGKVQTDNNTLPFYIDASCYLSGGTGSPKLYFLDGVSDVDGIDNDGLAVGTTSQSGTNYGCSFTP